MYKAKPLGSRKNIATNWAKKKLFIVLIKYKDNSKEMNITYIYIYTY